MQPPSLTNQWMKKWTNKTVIKQNPPFPSRLCKWDHLPHNNSDEELRSHSRDILSLTHIATRSECPIVSTTKNYLEILSFLSLLLVDFLPLLFFLTKNIFKIKLWFIYNIILVSPVQHTDLTFIYIMNWSSW